jgi:hypothetical protein
MPNPKVGTVSPDVGNAVKNAKSGQVRYRVDKAGIVHCTIGKASFERGKTQGEPHGAAGDLQKAKPATSKGIYMKRVTLSSTMGRVSWLNSRRSVDAAELRTTDGTADRKESPVLIDAGSAARVAEFHRRPQAGKPFTGRAPLMAACAGGAPLIRGSSSCEGHRPGPGSRRKRRAGCVIFRRGVQEQHAS